MFLRRYRRHNGSMNDVDDGADAQKSDEPRGRLRFGLMLDRLPPGIVIDHYAVDDLRGMQETDDPNDIVTHHFAVWTTLRDRAIDRWLDAERILRTACVLLLSPTTALQERVWDLMRRQGGDALIDLTTDLLEAKGHAIPQHFRSGLKALVRMRNLLAHQPSRPREHLKSDGLVFFKSVGFRAGEYVEVSYKDIHDVTNRAQPLMEWLTSEIPDSDGFSVPFEMNVFEPQRGEHP